MNNKLKNELIDNGLKQDILKNAMNIISEGSNESVFSISLLTKKYKDLSKSDISEDLIAKLLIHHLMGMYGYGFDYDTMEDFYNEHFRLLDDPAVYNRGTYESIENSVNEFLSFKMNLSKDNLFYQNIYEGEGDRSYKVVTNNIMNYALTKYSYLP